LDRFVCIDLKNISEKIRVGKIKGVMYNGTLEWMKGGREWVN
jgi:hypothetical protein